MTTDMDLKTETVGSIVANDLRTARIFKKYGIDFCCGGRKSLQLVCEAKKIDPVILEQELLSVSSDLPLQGSNAASWSLDFLIDYILNVHHVYIRERTPDLLAWSRKAARVHGEKHPELIQVDALFSALAEELEMHMRKEENVLFPYVRLIAAAEKTQAKISQPPFGSVLNPVSVMEHEHESAGAAIAEIRRITNDFTPPEDACNTYKAFYAGLKEFESDLFLHVHFENNILFPGAAAMENRLM